MKKEKGLEGAIALAYHVDYWDQLGWKDPFGAKTMTDVQTQYVRKLKVAAAYTPMFVVNGAMASSDIAAVTKKIGEERKATGRAVLALTGTKTEGGGTFEVTATIEQKETQPMQLSLVLAEDGLVTDIPAGERKGEKTTEFAVVRVLSAVSKPNDEGKASFELPVA